MHFAVGKESFKKISKGIHPTDVLKELCIRTNIQGGTEMSTSVTFQKVLEIVESLPEYQQENLIKIIRHRLIEHRRELLAKSIVEAREEYSRGEIAKGTVSDLVGDLSE